MRRDLGPGDLGDLLEQPLLATLATRLENGTTALSPVWHEWTDGGFVVCIPEGDVKLLHIRREPTVSILVAEHVLPYRGIEVRGAASRALAPFAATMRRFALRYLGAGADALHPDTAPGVVVRIAPNRIRCWGFADDMVAQDGSAGWQERESSGDDRC